MNIIYIHQHFSTTRGTTGTRSYDFARLLQARGHNVTVICGVYGSSDIGGQPLEGFVTRRTIDGLDVRILNVRYDNKQSIVAQVLSFLLFMAGSTVEMFRIRGTDVVFATSTPLTVGFPGTVARYLRGLPFVFEVRDIWPEWAVASGAIHNPLLILVAKMAARVFYRAADRIIAVGYNMGDRLRQQLGRAGGKVRVVPLGTDTAFFASATADMAWRREHGLEGKFVAVYAGAHSRLHALSWVLKAAALLKDEPHIRFTLIGDGVLKPALVEEARREGLANVLFLAPVPKEQLAGILRASDLGLMTIENLAIVDLAPCTNKFTDYLAAGLPALVNYSGEASRVCEEEGCGVVVPPENPEAMAEAIRRLARDPERVRSMGERARDVAARRFDRARLVEDFERVLEEARHG